MKYIKQDLEDAVEVLQKRITIKDSTIESHEVNMGIMQQIIDTQKDTIETMLRHMETMRKMHELDLKQLKTKNYEN
jgi:hypothetical protein